MLPDIGKTYKIVSEQKLRNFLSSYFRNAFEKNTLKLFILYHIILIYNISKQIK